MGGKNEEMWAWGFKFEQYHTARCTTLMLEGKGDFRMQRKIYTAKTAEHYICSLILLKRTSFYKC
ncbi:hypothetical protein MAR_014919 [Mya arenaria]|uniref:Uncharacterized protein n=1 Tax=Mya arenaria TaxID=6604 RepID=A0ABY7FFI6_MYAAR|nr:hypothetical protein MAR_014919 [Mya arenaria]